MRGESRGLRALVSVEAPEGLDHLDLVAVNRGDEVVADDENDDRDLLDGRAYCRGVVFAGADAAIVLHVHNSLPPEIRQVEVKLAAEFFVRMRVRNEDADHAQSEFRQQDALVALRAGSV